MKKTVLIIASDPWTLLRFRMEFMEGMIQSGHRVHAAATRTEKFLEIQKALAKKGITLHSVFLKNTGLNPFHDMMTLLDMGRIILKLRPEVVFSYTLKPVLYGSLVARILRIRSIFSMITGLGYVFTEHHPIIRWIVSLFYRISLKFNQRVFFQNVDDQDLFLSEKLVQKSKCILTHGSGVDLTYYNFSPISPTKNPEFLFVGRLLKKKGILEYIEAARILKVKYPKTSYNVLGDIHPNPSSLSQEEIIALSQKNLVHYLGRVDDVRSALRSCTVFVLPSYREGTPRAVLEAMAIGRPIITTDVPGCRETVKNGKNGYLVPARDAKALAEAMEKFILDPDLAPKMGTFSRKLAQEKYDVHQVNKVILGEMKLLEAY